jgi:sarcosine oxidase
VTDYRIIIIGLGGIGSGAAYWASRRLGAEVLGIEQFELGHSLGGSEDHSRIIRLSYHTPHYVEFAKRAYRAWEALAADAGEKVVLETGGLDLCGATSAIGLEDYSSAMTAAGVEFEELDAVEIRRRWPQFQIDDDVSGLFQERGGIAMASRANALHRRFAVENGARVLEKAAVTSLREVGGEVEVVVGSRTFRTEKLIIAAGAWTNQHLSAFGAQLPLEVSLEQVVYFDSPSLDDFAPERFPVWIWMDVPCFYGFPVFGEPAVKVSWDRCEVFVDPDNRPLASDPATTQRIVDFAARFLPGVVGPVRLAKTCLYTLTPDRDFVIDRVPGTDSVYVAVGAGHAFKFASLIGRALVDLALDGSTDLDLAPFRADRTVLIQPNPVRSYMV